MKNNLNKILILFVLLILSIGAVSASDDIADDLSVNSFSISETSSADSDHVNQIQSSIVGTDDSKDAKHADEVLAMPESDDDGNGSAQDESNLLGTTDEEDDEYFDGIKVYVDLNADPDEADGSEEHPFTTISDALGYLYDEGWGYDQILISPGYYTGDENTNLNIEYEGLLIKANGGPVIIGGCDNPIFTDMYVFDLMFKSITFANTEVERSIFEFMEEGGSCYLRFEGCTFENITSLYDSPIHFLEDTYANIFTDCNFINMKGENGGALYLEGEDYQFINCKFINNTADSDGGALYVGARNTVINGCEFINNSASNGGAIYNNLDRDYYSIEISNNEFDSNSAVNAGGSIYNNYGKIALSENTISNSNAETGKSIYNLGTIDDATVIIANNSTIVSDTTGAVEVSVLVTDDMGNIIEGKEVLIYTDTSTMEYGRVTASDNSSILISPEHLGATIVRGSYLGSSKKNCKNGVIIFNKMYTGPFYVATDGSDTNNGSEEYPFKTIEKALRFAAKDEMEHAVFIKEGTYYENSLVAPENNGINITGLGSVVINGEQKKILNSYSDFTNISNINFVNGKSDSKSAVYIRGNGVKIENCTFSKNTGKDNGALYIEGHNITVDDCTFTDNTGKDGGAIYATSWNGTISNCDFTNNTAVNGGAIYNHNYYVTISNCEFSDNTASGCGGSIYNEGENVTLTHNTISNSNAANGKKIYDVGSFKDYNITVLNNGTVTAVEGKLVPVSIKVTDDMGNEVSGNRLTVFLNGEELIANVLVSEGLATVSVNPPKGNSTVSAEYPGSGSVYTGTIVSDHDPYVDRIYVAPWGNDDNDGSDQHAVKSLEKAMELATASTNQVHEIWIRSGTYDVSNFVIGKPVSIIGYDSKETVIINGNGNNIFDIIADNVTISKVTLTNGTTNALTLKADNTHISDVIFDDAAISSTSDSANTVIEDCSFSNTGHSTLKGENLTIRNCNFTNVSSSENGGALKINAPNTLIDNCIFENCNPQALGGVIDGSGENFTIANSEFTNCHSSKEVGAIRLNSPGSTVENCTFTNVSSKSNIGAVSMNGINSIVNNCNFTNIESANYGAVQMKGANSTITNTNFNNVSTRGEVGALDFGDSRGKGGLIENCTFNNVHSGKYAGAIRVGKGGDDIVIRNCNFTNVSAEIHSGAISVSSNNVVIDNCDFTDVSSNTDFTATNAANTNGGAISIKGSNGTIKDSSFTNTSSKGNGGAIYIEGDGFNIDNCNFTNVAAQGYGGGIRLENSSNSNISNCNFINTTAYSGSSIALWGNNVNVENITSENSTSQEWGAIAIESKQDLSQDGTYFITTYSNNVKLNNIHINNSTSGEIGGGIYFAGQNGTLNNSVITNSKSFMGGGIYWNGDNGIIDNTDVSSNNANIGAGIAWYGEEGTIKNSNVTYNVASQLYGGIAYSSPLDIKENNNISHNRPTPEYGNFSSLEDDPVYKNLVVHTTIYTDEPYLMDMTDGSVGSCVNPDRGAPDENDIYIVLTADTQNQMRKLLRASSTTTNVLSVTNNKNGKDVSEYLKILYYDYYTVITDTKFKEAYAIFLNGNYLTDTNQYVKKVRTDFNNGRRIPTTGAQKLFMKDGQLTLRVFDFTTLINSNPSHQNLFAVNYEDTTLYFNITVEKITLTPEVPVGNQTKFLIRVTNTGNWQTNSIVVSEVSYDGLIYHDYIADSSWSFIGTKDNPKWKYLGNLNAGEHVEFTVIFNTTTPGNFTNIVTATNGNDTDTGNNTTHVMGYGIKVEKISLTPDVPIGDQTKFIIRVTNTGELNLTNVNVTEVKYEGLTYAGFEDSTGKWIFQDGSNKPMWIYKDTLLVGKSAEFTVIFNTTRIGNFTNIVTAGNNRTNDTGNNTTEVHRYGIKVEKITLTPDVPIGDQTSFIIRVTNTGDWELTNVNVTEKEYEGLVYDSFVDSTGKWIFQDGSDKPMWIYDGVLPIGASANFTVVFNTTKVGNFTNIVTAGNNKTNDTGNNTTKVHEYGIKVEKITLTPDVPVGNQTSFIIRVTNTGDWELTNVNVTEVKYEGLIYAGFEDSTEKWIFQDGSDKPMWIYDGVLHIGESANFTVIFNTTTPGNFTNIVTAGNNKTNDTGNNTTKVHEYGIKVEKISLTPHIPVGDQTSFIIRVTNTGDWELTNVNVTEVKYDGLTYDSFKDSTGKWIFQDGSSKPMWIYNDVLPIGESAEFTVIFNATEKGNFTNIVTAGNDKTNDTGNNTTVVHPYGMKVEKISLTKVVSVGMPAYFLINVTNTGEWELKDINVTEMNSEGIQYEGFIDTTGKWEFIGTMEHPVWLYNATLPVGESAELMVYYKTLRAGNFTNVVTVGDNESESKAQDNDTITIKNPEFKVEKITLTPRVYLGELASFLIKVTNTGDCDLGEVYVKELSYDGMVYDHFTDRSGIWEFDGKNKWSYKFPIAPNETIQFTVFFKTVSVGKLTNIIVSGNNETNETTTENVTEVYVNKTDDANKNRDKDKKNHDKDKKKHSGDEDESRKYGHSNSRASSLNSSEGATGNPILMLLASIMVLFVSTRYRRR